MNKFLNWLIGVDTNASILTSNHLKDAEVLGSFGGLIKYAEFKRIFEQIISYGEKYPFKTICILSQEVGEGKTLFSSLFAYSFCNLLKKKVLIIDTQTRVNSRSHVLDNIFEVEDLDHKLFQPKTSFQLGVDIIHLSSGHEDNKENNSEYVIQYIIDKFSSQYDLVIVDTCAISLRNQNNFDPIVISNRLDTTLYITSSKSLESNFIVELKEKIKLNPRYCLGVIYNRGVS